MGGRRDRRKLLDVSRVLRRAMRRAYGEVKQELASRRPAHSQDPTEMPGSPTIDVPGHEAFITNSSSLNR